MLRVADHVVALASLLTTVVVDFPIEYTCLPLVSRAAVRLSSDLLAIQAWMGAHAVISEVNAAALFKTAVLLMANHLPRMVNQVVFDDFTPADDKKKGLTVSNVTLVKLLSDVNRFIFVTFNSAVATHFLRAIHTLLLSERWAGELDAIVPFIEKVTGELPRAMWLCCPMMVLSGVASFGPYVGAPIHFNKPGVGEREGYIVNLSAKYGQAVVAYRGENALEEETTVDLEDVCPTSFTSPQTTCIPTKCVRLIITATAERIFGATMKKTWNVFDLQAAVHTLYILRGMADSDPAALEYLLKKKTILLINRASSLLPVQSPVPFALLPVFVESAYRGYMERFVPVYKKFLNSTSPGAVPFTYEIPGEVNVFTKLRSAPTSSLCFDPSQNSACVVITPSSKDAFPVWKDGLYFEFSVFLRYLNAAGLAEASSSTSLWTAPSVQLDLLSVCLPPTKGKEDEPPLLKLSIVNDAVRCVLSARGNTVEVRADLFSSDLDTFTHMAVVLNEHHMTVMKSGEQNSTQFLPSVAKDVGNKLKTAGGISHLVIGNRGVSGVEVAECATERVMVKEFRMGTNTKHMQKAELIHRDGSLSSPSSADECYFQFNEGTGALCCSTNKKYTGALQGSVCWCPAPATVGSPVNLSDRTALFAGEAPPSDPSHPYQIHRSVFGSVKFP
ncbi:hypothetical protein ADEAN_000716700 [Angomonas deanei]|uniref:Uncharacterized protein n=1 Tax=Angomonas deanei TaxID=59799 RepID=A0A7G2CIH8_9TRYP|nr:hypothetical protein ADEAN_000716700 [Angomonas deanei]